MQAKRPPSIPLLSACWLFILTCYNQNCLDFLESRLQSVAITEHSCNENSLQCPGFYENDEYKWEMLGLVTLTVFLISYPSFAASVGLHHSKWVPVGAYLDPLFIRPPLCNPPITGKLKSFFVNQCVCSGNRFWMNCWQTGCTASESLALESTGPCAEQTIQQRA